MRSSFFILFIALLAFSCKKPENRTCFKFSGSETTKEIPLASFNRLELKEHVEYVLIQDSLDKVVLKGGKNLLNLIEVNVADGLLTIENKNRCGFLRNAKKVVVAEIHFTKLINIRFIGTEPLRSQGTIYTDYFTFYSRDGAGEVNLDLNAILIDAEANHGWCNFTLTGVTQKARICAKSNSYCDVTGLTVTDSIYVASETVGDMKINADNLIIHGYITESGNIFYKGTPLGADVLLNGTGKVYELK
ncbi:GIN domain-containing protein [Fluviicola sp.]|uniref:GIN domain-containing protein n=1 Tax=Fluviicola sp. TaxID=1917219 RepID=UPI003D2E93BC